MKPRVLIVDDEPDMLDFVERVLRSDYQVTKAGGAAEALELLEADQGFDALITDQTMPKVSGLELLERIDGRFPQLARLLLSGFSDLPEVQGTAAEKVHHFLVKPIDSDHLRAALRESIKRVRAGSDSS